MGSFLFRQFALFVRVQPRKHIEALSRTDHAKESESTVQNLTLAESLRSRRAFEEQSHLLARNRFQFRKIIVPALPSDMNCHLSERANSIRIPTIVGLAYFMSADAIIDNFLLVS
jgi:hypothetical protein